MADLIPLKAGRNIWGHCDLKDVFPNEEGEATVEAANTMTNILYLFG